ncbi:MAG: ABC transporter substrate-binding protein [Chloroflexota bacterium]|nr:ABC transporter substrate-binding protein [Chloroflexota bacterium]MDE3192425.1 ABC transporter substrate-binding protein [Chloroflexota bacterium]
MRALAGLALLAVVSACSAVAPPVATPTPTPQHGVLAVTALLDLSGPRAAIGTAQRDALQLWLDQQQGKTRFPVKLHVVDAGGSEAKLLLDLHAAAVDAASDAVIVGAPVIYDATFGAAVEAAALPVLFTLPLPDDPVAGDPGGRWAFALAPALAHLASDEVNDAVLRRTLSPSLVLSGPREQVDLAADALEAELQARELDRLTRIPLPTDGSVPPVVRSSLSVLRSVHCTAPASSCAAVARAAQSMGAPTFFYLSYLTTPRDLQDHKELAARAVWPSSARILPFNGRPLTPENQARDAFMRAFGDRFGTPSAHAATAYDALSLLTAAADAAGPDDRGALRSALERITMPLIATTYTFGPDRHAGDDLHDVTYVRWTGSAVAPALAATLGTGIATPTPSPTASPTATGSARP